VRRSRRRTRQVHVVLSGLLAVAGATAGGWWYWTHRANLSQAKAAPALDTALVATRPGLPLIIDEEPAAFVWPKEPEPVADADQARHEEVLRPVGATTAPTTVAESEPRTESPARPAAGADERSNNPAIEAARQRYGEGKPIEARHALNALLAQGKLARADQAEVRKLLTTIADETIFAKRRLPDDPLVDLYAVQTGDVLVRIGREFKVPPEVLMRINGIKSASALRAEQKIKVLRGPFHAKIYKSDFRMDVYLQDLYVRSFRVGLGADQGTPEGVWRVKERLENPTYYPPASAETKRIIPPDDPQNPLGEHWIGLEGLEGDAQGRYGYGIHGTIEPESVGKAVSLGCVRMHNEDVVLLFALLLPGQSTVTVLP